MWKDSYFMKVDVAPSGGQYVKEDVMIIIPLEKYAVHPTFTAGIVMVLTKRRNDRSRCEIPITSNGHCPALWAIQNEVGTF